MLPYRKDTAIKYLIIRTESCKVILPSWQFRSKQRTFSQNLLVVQERS